MRTRRLAALGVAPVAAASPPRFGHAFAPRDGALTYPIASDAARVPRVVGVPLAVVFLRRPRG